MVFGSSFWLHFDRKRGSAPVARRNARGLLGLKDSVLEYLFSTPCTPAGGGGFNRSAHSAGPGRWQAMLGLAGAYLVHQHQSQQVPGEAWRSLERLGESLEAKRDHFFSRIDQNCTKNRPWRPQWAPKWTKDEPSMPNENFGRCWGPAGYRLGTPKTSPKVTKNMYFFGNLSLISIVTQT